MFRNGFSHPVWLVGFRPFFTLSFLAAVILPLVWVGAFSGHLQLPSTGLSGVQWHAHEMLYGFGWAILGGFLLTASKNWVHIRGLWGGPLALAVFFWLIERGAIFFVATDPRVSPVLRFFLLNAFVLYVGGYVVWSLIRYRKQDTFSDNYFFLIALPLFLIAKNLLLSPEFYAAGVAMTIGLFRVAFAVMMERTTTQFMKNATGTQILRNPALDTAIKGSVLVAVFAPFLPAALAASILALAATLLLIRFVFWKPLIAIRHFGIAVMYAGYLGLTTHLYLEALRVSGLFMGVGTLSTHVFTFACMGIIIPSMLIRICQGHTGRKLVFTTSDRIAIGVMGLATFFRVVATQLWPAAYTEWITLAGIGWAMCFALVGIRLTPFLWKARLDGRTH